MTLGLMGQGAAADTIASARFINPTEHYDHGILGDGIEYSGMMIRSRAGKTFVVRFPEGTRVFEDLEPRLWDVSGDDFPEVVVIETDPSRGAQLAIYGMENDRVRKIASTPHIGQTHRWLAPVGAADLDGDGKIEVAFVDRPHLAKLLRVWRFDNGRFEEVGKLDGITNHQIGWNYILGGIRDCGGRPEMVVATADWTRILAVGFDRTGFSRKDLRSYGGRASFKAAMSCKK